MRRGGPWIFGVVVLALLAGSCQNDATARPTAAAARELRAAAERTLAEPSFRVRINSMQSGESHTATGGYQAPDRTELRAGSTDRITIGNTAYQRFGNDGVNSTDPDVYYRTVVQTPPGDLPLSADLSALLARAARKGAVVSRSDVGYEIATPGRGKYPPATLSFRVTHGRVTQSRLLSTVLGKPFVQDWRYFDFGAPVSIEAPPADQIHDAPTAAAPIPAPAG